MKGMEKAAPPQGQPAYGNCCSLEARMQSLEQRLDKMEREALTPGRLRDELAKGEKELDYS